MTNQGGIMLSMQLVLVILYASMTVYSPNQKVILRTDYSCKYIFYYKKKTNILWVNLILDYLLLNRCNLDMKKLYLRLQETKYLPLTRLKHFEELFRTYKMR